MYFFDTYALLAIVRGSDNYRRYTNRIEMVSLKLNLYEMYHLLVSIGMVKEAESYYGIFAKYAVDSVPDDTIKKAAWFRYKENKGEKKKFSYIDALGYVYAMENGAVFLTGDGRFEGYPNVEFVKE